MHVRDLEGEWWNGCVAGESIKIALIYNTGIELSERLAANKKLVTDRANTYARSSDENTIE